MITIVATYKYLQYKKFNDKRSKASVTTDYERGL